MSAGRQLPAGLHRARHDLLEALAGLKEEHCRTRPEPGGRTIQEILGALAAADRHVAALLQSGQDPGRPMPPELFEAARQRGRSLMLPALVHDLNGARAALIRLLSRLPAPTVRAVAALLVSEDRAALARILRVCELLDLR